MKIVGCSNFGIESVADVLVAENVSEYHGKVMVEALNDAYSGENAMYYYHLKPDDYRLWRGMEELV